MYAYYLTRALTVHARGQRKTLQPAAQATAPASTEIHVAAQRELEMVRAAVRETYQEEALDGTLRLLPPAALARVPGLPVTLGAGAYADPAAEAAPGCLVSQLQALKAAHPHRRHFRLLLINAFGTNLGDSLIGIGAYRQLLAVLRTQLPEVSVDVLLGWHKDDRLALMFGAVDGIDAVLTQGPTLAELSRYQAVVDTNTLLTLPRYGQLPMVDWYLWWMGLDPQAVPAGEKRNAVDIAADATTYVASRLPAAVGPRFLVNPKASVTLRTMPDSITQRLVEQLLAAWPRAQVILIQPLAFEHPRVVDLSAAIDTAQRLAAVVALADGLIGVDTYTQHLADATATPAVTLFTSVSPDLYPYYPLGETLLLPDARTLPAWGKMKVRPAEWAHIGPAYEAAWQALDMNAVLSALQRAMQRKADAPEAFAPRRPPWPAAPLPRTRTVTVGTATIEVPRHQRDDAMAATLDGAIAAIARQVLCVGDTVVQLGAGVGESALALAQQVGRHGRLVAFEPRRELHQRLCANLAGAGIGHADTHAVMPVGEVPAVRDINRLCADDEYLPMQIANSAIPEQVMCWPLDTLALGACRLIVVRSPMPLLSVLQGARATLERLRPVVLAGVLPLRSAPALESFLAGLGYQTRLLELGAPGGLDQAAAVYGILVAEPSASPANKGTQT